MSSLFCKKLKFCLFFLFFYCIGAAFAQEPEPSGPISITNQHPLYVFFLNPLPDKAGPQEPGKLSLDSRYTISNINVRQFSFPPASDIDRVELDMEIHKLDFDFRYGLNEKVDLELSVPYLIFWEGFLDSAIDFFEDTLGVKPPSSRGDRGTNRYRYFLRVNSETLIDRESGDGGFGDSTLFLKYKFFDEQGFLPGIAMRAGVKFPTGSKGDLLGSGKFDYDAGVLFQKQISRLFLYLNFDIVFIEKPKVFGSMALDSRMVSGFLGLEYFFNKRLSFLLQSGMMSTPFPKVSQVTSLERSPGHIGIGINYNFNQKSSLKLSVIENVSSASPDIMLQAGLKLKF